MFLTYNACFRTIVSIYRGRENQFYLDSFLHKGLPFNAPPANFGSDLDGAVYKRRNGGDGADLPTASWYSVGELTLRP
jgi:hypothetical protein